MPIQQKNKPTFLLFFFEMAHNLNSALFCCTLVGVPCLFQVLKGPFRKRLIKLVTAELKKQVKVTPGLKSPLMPIRKLALALALQFPFALAFRRVPERVLGCETSNHSEPGLTRFSEEKPCRLFLLGTFLDPKHHMPL